MALRTLTRLPRLKGLISYRHTPHLLGYFSAANNDGRQGESRKYDRYTRANALLAQIRDIHISRRNESTMLFAGVGIAASAVAARYGFSEYQKYKAKQGGAGAKEGEATQSEKSTGGESNKAKEGDNAGNMFGAFGKRYYEGGFDDKMTRREAARILGVRESAALQRIKDSHRRILMINHPDKGGSKYMAAKINEAKEVLKGR